MDTGMTECERRREGVRRYLLGERTGDICRDLERDPRWLTKWVQRYRDDPATDFVDQSRAPHHSPQQTSPQTEALIVAMRRARESGQTEATRYGFIGHRSVRADLEQLRVHPLPSPATIQRVMSRHGLTHPIGANQDAAYYPWPQAWAPGAIQATDLITRHLRGGARVENAHTIDLDSLSAWMTQAARKSSGWMVQHLLKTWAILGWPWVHQTDNEAVFSGGHTHVRVIGQTVRLCLFCGVEPLFIPVYEPKRNYQVETFHSEWVRGFWARRAFADLPEVVREAPLYRQWYHTRYQPPSLDGDTPDQVHRASPPRCLEARLGATIPVHDLPLTAGRIHFLRRVDAEARVSLLNEQWAVPPKWIGHYVRATINLAERCVSFWHQPDAESAWVHLKTRRFTMDESIHAVLPEFTRKSERCREQWPD
jgi:transposase-like protein